MASNCGFRVGAQHLHQRFASGSALNANVMFSKAQEFPPRFVPGRCLDAGAPSDMLLLARQGFHVRASRWPAMPTIAEPIQLLYMEEARYVVTIVKDLLEAHYPGMFNVAFCHPRELHNEDWTARLTNMDALLVDTQWVGKVFDRYLDISPLEADGIHMPIIETGGILGKLEALFQGTATNTNLKFSDIFIPNLITEAIKMLHPAVVLSPNLAQWIWLSAEYHATDIDPSLGAEHDFKITPGSVPPVVAAQRIVEIYTDNTHPALEYVYRVLGALTQMAQHAFDECIRSGGAHVWFQFRQFLDSKESEHKTGIDIIRVQSGGLGKQNGTSACAIGSIGIGNLGIEQPRDIDADAELHPLKPLADALQEIQEHMRNER